MANNLYTNSFNNNTKQYFKEIKKYKSLTKEREHLLGEQIKNGNNLLMNELVTSKLKFVVSVAKKYRGNGVPFLDLIEEGNIGLLKAMEKYDYKKDNKFLSYAVWWIRQSIQECIKKSYNNKEYLIGSNINYNILENIGDISDDDYIKNDDIDTELLNDLLYDDVIYYPDKNFEDKDIKVNIIKDLLNNLTKRERNIISLYFGLNGGNPMKLEEIGEKYNISKERSRQIKEKAMRKLRSLSLSNSEIQTIYR
jgi:RNA polymerase primary sigma factor